MKLADHDLFDLKDGIAVPAEELNLIAEVTSDQEKKVREKPAPDERPTYSCPVAVKTKDKNGFVISSKNIFVNTIEPLDVEFSEDKRTYVKGEGKAWVKAFVQNERIAYSITVERFKPFNPSSGSQSTAPQAQPQK